MRRKTEIKIFKDSKSVGARIARQLKQFNANIESNENKQHLSVFCAVKFKQQTRHGLPGFVLPLQDYMETIPLITIFCFLMLPPPTPIFFISLY